MKRYITILILNFVFLNIQAQISAPSFSGDTSICVGNSTSINAQGISGATFNWWDAQVGGNLLHTGASYTTMIYTTPGIYNLYVDQTSSGITSLRTNIIITVSPIPTISAYSSKDTICQGDSVILSAIGADSYSWNPGNLTGDSITVYLNSSNTYSVVGETNNCFSPSVNISVYVPEISNVSSKTICNGSSTTLSTNGADSYIWNPGGLTGNSISISPNVTTIYTVTGYWNTTVCTANKSATVTVNPLPLSMSVSPDFSVVSGTRITLSASCTDCISYSWSTNYGNYGSLNGGSIKVVPIDSTIYYVSGSNNYNCSISDSIIVSINYYMPNITGLCDVPYGSNTTLTASGIGPFTWYNDQYQGVLLHTGSSFTTPNLYSDTKFWVSDNGGPRKQVSVSITYGVTSISASLDTICGNNYSFLSANVQSGYVNWYTNATGGSPFITSFSGNNIAVLPSQTTTYFAEANRQEFSQTFNYTGGVQTFTVPDSVHSLRIDAAGAGYVSNYSSGKGGRVQSTISVNPGEVLYLYVGGKGSQAGVNYSSGFYLPVIGAGGWNGGGNSSTPHGATPSGGGWGGSGASDIRIGGTSLVHRVLVAGGGGGGGNNVNGASGGGLIANGGASNYNWIDGTAYGGAGGNQNSGGNGGGGSAANSGGVTASGKSGAFGVGGNSTSSGGNNAGAGGGGWFGGGGGSWQGDGLNASGGGGGSSYTSDSLNQNVIHTKGYRNGNGYVTISYYRDTTVPVRVPITIYVLPNPGCTDLAACNYDSLATCDDGSCLTLYGCTDPVACNYDSLATCDDGSCNTVYGCTDPVACNYDPLATCDDASCLIIYGCTDSTLCNYDPLATCDDGSCGVGTLGCTDSMALNYNINAVCDDGSCIAVVYGCTDPLAINYDINANIDNGFCCHGPDSLIWRSLSATLIGDGSGSYGYNHEMDKNGDRIVVGSRYNDVNGNNSGLAKVYEFNGVSWTQLGQDIYGSFSNDMSGWSVSISGDGSIIAIGSPRNDANGTDAGSVRVYDFDGAIWNQIGQTILGDTIGDESGRGLSLNNDGSILAIGAAIYGQTDCWPVGQSYPNCNGQGQVKIFEYISGTWSQIGQGVEGFDNNDRSGGTNQVKLNSSGDIVAIGSAWNDSLFTNGGYTRILKWDGNNWNQLGTPIFGENTSESSGRYVSISDDGYTVAIGAPYYDNSKGRVGVYTYDTTSAIWSKKGSDIVGENNGDKCGWGLSITGDGNTTAVGYKESDPAITRVFDFDIQTSEWIQRGLIEDLSYTQNNLSISINDAGNRVSIGNPSDQNAGSVRIFDYINNLPCIYGCTDVNATNYNPVANTDDESCCLLSASAVVVNESAVGANDGAIDLTVNGSSCSNVTNLNLPICPAWSYGAAFNVTNTNSYELFITGFSQGPGESNQTVNNVVMGVYYTAQENILWQVNPWSSSFVSPFTLLATDTVNLTKDTATGYIAIPQLAIPAGETYTFWVGPLSGYVGNEMENNSNISFGDAYQSDSNLTISYSVNASYSSIINGQTIMNFPQKWSGTVHYIDTLYNVYSYLWNSGHTNEDIDGLNQGVYSVIASDCNGCSTTVTATVGLLSGCTDPNACNFDPSAVSDDGSCLNNLGCTDYLACNYDPLANCDDGSCLTLYGCTDITSCNYDSLATCDDGSCLNIYGCTDLLACNYNPLANCDDGSCNSIYGCTDPYACNYNPLATCDDGSCLIYYGCTDPLACNYNPLATCDDGSCLNMYGCTDLLACNYNPLANCDDGSCLFLAGCTDSIACNFNPLAACDDGSCNSAYGCTDPLACNYDSLVTCDDGSCLTYYGCTDPSACNYNPFASCDDGSCNLVYGCTDSLACNYDPLVTCDDGSCNIAYGCTDPLACNYNPLATCDDGSCNTVYGCTDIQACNYDSLATCDDGSCNIAYGCTDVNACNFNPLATCDDGSCNTVYGCTDTLAYNYDSQASCDDGTCAYNFCANPTPTNIAVVDIIDTRARVTWDNMTSVYCTPEQYRIEYRVLGTNSWNQKNAVSDGTCTSFGQTGRLLTNLLPATTYEYRVKAWYCYSSGSSSWSGVKTFTTLSTCPNVGNFVVSTPTTTRAKFTWDDSNGSYSFVRIKLRVDTISNPTFVDWQNAGGFGVNYGTWTRNKNGLVAGETYRGQSRTWCDPNGGPYKSANWTPLIFWTQPTSVRMENNFGISELEVYPNPSRDIFNISFTIDEVQDFTIRVVNLLGEEIIKEDVQQFVGEYVKSINLNQFEKAIYLLEIITDNGTINKKLMLQ